MRKLLLLIAVTSALSVCGGMLVAGPATAAGLTAPVADCVKNQALTHNYSASELRNALATMPADLSEYSNCYAIIQHALEEKIGNLHGGSGSGGGSFLPTWLLILLIVLVLGGPDSPVWRSGEAAAKADLRGPSKLTAWPLSARST